MATRRSRADGPHPAQKRVRALTASDLSVAVTTADTSGDLASEIRDDDLLWLEIAQILEDGYAGAILVGPPGTSKSWYAARIAAKLVAGESHLLRFVQFHPSYQYEDFVEGYVPRSDGGFDLKSKHFSEMCALAAERPSQKCVLVIDEFSRVDAARVFGEALTYLEMSKRNMTFTLSSGTELMVPPNLIILATMNPWDRGVDEVDMALERRFAKIRMDPDPDLLEEMLARNNVAREVQIKVRKFFEIAIKHKNPLCHIGHAYFQNVKDEAGLQRLWKYQLHAHFSKACRLDPEAFKQIEAQWNKIFSPDAAAAPGVGVPLVEPNAQPIPNA